MSKLYVGTVADYTMLKQEFPPGIDWFEQKEVRVDLGFQGFVDDYTCARVRIPHKRKRVAKGQSNALTPQQLAYNTELARERVGIEHCIGRIKQMRFIQQTIRLHRLALLGQLIQVAVALANFKLHYKFC